MRSGSFLVVVSVILAFLVAYPVYGADKGDLTADGYVDMDDLSVIAGDWLTNGTLADLAPIAGNPNVSISDGDGIVDNKDLALLAENWRNESLTVSSNALDYSLQQILDTHDTEWGTDRYPSRTIQGGYYAWDRAYHKSEPDYPDGTECWTLGFYPGCLWYMYELTGDDSIKAKARLWTERIESQKNNTVFGDQGFVLMCSFGQGYRLGGSECNYYKDVVITGANSLATRYNDVVGCIDSWDWGGYATKFTTIIDTMMNIEILFWASKNGGGQNLYDIAVNHAYKTRDEFVRLDGSTCNTITFSETTGEPIEWECDPAEPWSRGQAWAVYGFTMTYRETGDPNFLATAQACADYFLDNLPTDKVPPQHFNSTTDYKDSSASAITAAGLLELCTLVTDPLDQERYYNQAKEILTSLSTRYWDGGYMGNDADVCILREVNGGADKIWGWIYGDYYFVEALMRYYELTGWPE